MKYNVLEGAIWSLDTVSGTKDLGFYDIHRLAEYGNIPITTLSGSDILIMDFDFGRRIHLDRFEYKFYSDTPTPSDLEFYYKEENFEDFTQLPTLVSGTNTFFTTISGAIFAPRYFRFKHTVTSSGTLYGFRALNDDSVVDFGETGLASSESIEVARGGDEYISTVPIYNSSNVIANAFVTLEADSTEIYNITSISANIDGPWQKVYSESDTILDKYNYSYGIANQVQLHNENIRIIGTDVDYGAGYVSRLTEGTYETPIFKLDGNYNNIFIDKVGDHGGYLRVDLEDASDTIEIRHSEEAPTPYAIFREMRQSGATVGSVDRWLYSGTLKGYGAQIGVSMQSGGFTHYNLRVDSVGERWVGHVCEGYLTGYGSGNNWFISGPLDSANYLEMNRASSYNAILLTWYDCRIVSTGGFWVHFFSEGGNTSLPAYRPGYYLMYLDADLNILFTWYEISQLPIGKFDADYDDKYLWYTLPDTATVVKLSNSGEVLLTYVDEDILGNVGGIAVMPDKGIMVSNGKDIHRIKSSGLYLPEYSLYDVSDENISYLVLDEDGSEAVWIIDGLFVARLYVSGEHKGTYDFKIEMVFPVYLVPTPDGVLVYCADTSDLANGSMSGFISKISRRLEVYRAPAYNVTGSSPGIIYQKYTEENYLSKTPLSIDPYWSNLEWYKISTDNYIFSEDQYYQIRLLLKDQKPIDRYPELITDPTVTYVNSDSFDNGNIRPRDVFWGDWKNYPALDRVYVDTAINDLIMTPDWTTSTNSYISTKDRVVFGLAAAGVLDILIYYKFGENGVATGRNERFYLDAYSVSDGFEGEWIKFYWNIPHPYTSDSRAYYRDSVGNPSYTQRVIIYDSLNLYDSVFRLYITSTHYRIYWLSEGTWDYGGYEIPIGTNDLGDLFYFVLTHYSQSSQMVVKNFYLNQGYAYHYKDNQLIKSINQSNLLEISNIYPNTSKNAYVKTQVPETSSVGSDYSVDLKVNWKVPV